MSFNDPAISYRQSAISGATPVGLVIALYDKLASDFRLAVDAIRADDIEARCQAVNHAMLVLGQLQDWVNMDSGEALAQSLVSFYQMLRARLLEASLKKSAELLEEQILLILQVRGAWQERDSQTVPEFPGPLASAATTSGSRLSVQQA